MNRLEITEIQIIPVKPHNGLLAFASAVLNNQFYISNIAIHTSFSSSTGYRLVYPDKTLANGKRIQCFYPINRAAGENISNAIINKYVELIGKVNSAH
jgi:DNA-binding cell septation regulator SpoVG